MPFSIEDPRKWPDFIPDTLQTSSLYNELCENIKGDTEMLAIVLQVDPPQPNLVTFFAGVDFLLLWETYHPLALDYSSLHQEEVPSFSEAEPFFREFILAHLEKLRNLLPTARLQTNEVTRCTNSLPAFVPHTSVESINR